MITACLVLHRKLETWHTEPLADQCTRVCEWGTAVVTQLHYYTECPISDLRFQAQT
jgi:hypothetical protein